MFKHLSVKNFAIIEDGEIDFKEGLTCLTGETGAGKSLIIDSINLLLGDRAASEMIRNGEDKATITGVFTIDNKRLLGLLNKLDIDVDNNELVISRVISNKNNVIRVNGKVVTLNELKSISKYLADIHQQFDMVKLLNKENYLDIVDGFKYDLIKESKDVYLASLEALKEKERQYLALIKNINEIKERRDIYEYELKELEALNLSIGEEEAINEEIEFLKNYDHIFELLQDIKSTMDRDSLSDIYKIKENLNQLSKYQGEYQEAYDKLNDYYYEIEAIYEDLTKKINRLDYDPKRLEELEERRSDINIVKKKYKKDIPELIEYKSQLENILKSNEDLDTQIKEEKEAFVSLYKKTYQDAINLSLIRKETSKNIEKEIENNLKDLELNSHFQIVVNENKIPEDYNLNIFTVNGINDIDFLIETNIGEGLKPLNKIASGGEMSRIMLAIKALFIKSQKISTVIFDEVDTGISGKIASKVANKIKDISLSSQVIIITHLPQVAALSNHHIKIAKEVKNNRTFTNIKELSLDEKIYEIALMISDGKVSEKQIEYAKEMVLNN